MLICMYAHALSLSNAVLPEDDNTESIQTLAEKLKDVTPEWSELGLQLNLSPVTLDEIKANPQKDPVVKKFDNMLKYWIKDGKEDTRTWGFLAMAVEKSRNNALARRIRERSDYKEGSKGISIFRGIFSSLISRP